MVSLATSLALVCLIPLKTSAGSWSPVASHWTLLKNVPDGARIASFSTLGVRHLDSFGLRLQVHTIPTTADGRLKPYAHEKWKEHWGKTWWDRNPAPQNLDHLTQNLLDLGVEYVIVTRKKKKEKWPAQFVELSESPQARRISSSSIAVLFRLSP